MIYLAAATVFFGGALLGMYALLRWGRL